jgi:hypothetical protein
MPCAPLLIALLLHAEPDVSLTDREVLERAETEFREGLRLRQAREQARPHFRNAAGYFDELAMPICLPMICRTLFCRIIAVCVWPRTIAPCATAWSRRGSA